MKRKTISFRLEGRIKVPCKATYEDVLEWLRANYEIENHMDADNPVENDYEVEDSIEYNFVEIM